MSFLVLKLMDGVLDLCYPPHCVSCGRAVHELELPLCRRCRRGLERATPEGVRARLNRLDNGPLFTDGFCHVQWVLHHDDTLEQVQHVLKYGNRPRYGISLGALIGHTLLEMGVPGTLDTVVPVPLHRARYLERGYNQSACLAAGIAAQLGVPLEASLLRRTRATPSQTHLDRPQREKNVAGAFIAENPAPGRHCLLVDDLVTTGSTLVSAAMALRAAGNDVSLCALGIVAD